jgi:hypothetical protein
MVMCGNKVIMRVMANNEIVMKMCNGNNNNNVIM